MNWLLQILADLFCRPRPQMNRPLHETPQTNKDAGRVILIRDESSSMESFGAIFVEAWNGFIGRMAEKFPVTVLSFMGVNGCVRIHARRTCFAELALAPLSEAEFRYCPHEGGRGMLGPGSRLIDALVEAADFIQQWRNGGYQGPLGIVMFADGWSRLDEHTLDEGRIRLARARELGAVIQFIAFVRDEPWIRASMDAFVSGMGLAPEEVNLEYHQPGQAAAGIRDSFAHGETAVLRATTCF